MKDIFKRHSCAGCVKCGYLFLAENLGITLRVMLPYYLCLAALFSAYIAMNTWVNVVAQVSGDVPLWAALSALSLFLLSVIMHFLCAGRLVLLLRRRGKVEPQGTSTLRRTLRIALMGLPCALRFFFKSRAKGKILLTTLLAGFTCVVASVIPFLPVIICTYAYFTSVEGAVNYSDPTGMTTSGFALMFFACVLAFTCINFIFTLLYGSWLYLWGSVKTNTAQTTTSDEKTALH